MSSSGAPGAMDSLKSRIPKKGRKNRNGSTPSRVRQFYDEFNSSQESNSSNNDSDDDKTTFFGYKNRPRAPMIRPLSANRPMAIDLPAESNATPSDESSVTSPRGNFQYPEVPISPGLSKNQDIKDSALNVIYQKRIKELKSKTNK